MNYFKSDRLWSSVVYLGWALGEVPRKRNILSLTLSDCVPTVLLDS